MSVKRKVFLAFSLAALLLLATLCGIFLYFYFHPSSVKSLVEISMATSTGARWKIERLSYSLSPLRLRARGVIVQAEKNGRGLYMDIPNLRVDMSMEGPMGQRTLVLDLIEIHGFSLRLDQEVSLPKPLQNLGKPSLLNGILKRMTAVFLFRDIRIEAVEVVNGDVSGRLGDQEIQVRAIQADLSPDHRLAVSGSGHVQWPMRNMSLTFPEFRITTDRIISFANPEMKGSLAVGRATFQSPQANARGLSVGASFIYNHSLEELSLESLDVHLEGLALKNAPEEESPPFNVQLSAAGLLNLRDNTAKLSSVHLTVGDILAIEGKLQAGLGNQQHIGLAILNGRLLPEGLMPLLPARMTALLSSFRLSGPVGLHGEVSGLKESNGWTWNCNLEARLAHNDFSYITRQMKTSGQVSGSILAEGRIPEVGVSAAMKVEKAVLSAKGIELKPFEGSFLLSGRYPIYTIKDVTAHIPQVRATTGKRHVALDDIRVHILKGSLNVVKRTLLLPEIRLDSALLKNLLLSLKVGEEEMEMKLWGKHARLIQSALDLELLPSGWKAGGADALQIHAVLKKGEEWTVSSAMDLQEVSLQSRDSSMMGERISLHAEMNGTINMKSSRVTGNVLLEIRGGEILYDRFYVDLNKHAFSSSFAGSYGASEKLIQLADLKLELRNILTIDAKGTIAGGAPNRRARLRIHVPATAFEPAFDLLVREPFQAEKPFLKPLKAGGIVSADLELINNGVGWILSGHCLWQKGELSSDAYGFSLQGIDLDLPILYQIPKAQSAQRSIKGTLTIRDMTLPFLPKQALTLQLDSGPNLLSVRYSTALKVPGGEIQWGPVIWKDPLYAPPFIQTSLALDAVNLNPLLSDIWPLPIYGTMKGKLDPVQLEGDGLSTQGDLAAEVFGGEIIFSDLHATGIFTSVPVFKLNAHWHDLNLAELTTGTSFGKIEGVLRGHVTDLEIANGQPQRFNLLVETVKKKGIDQKISVQAIDNIAQIGGSQSPFMGITGVFSSLFREFPYEKIGVSASLQNDVFRINGTIKEGGTEYLVKKGGLTGVDIINQNPDNRISFKDMVKRIKRITTTHSPVVK